MNSIKKFMAVLSLVLFVSVAFASTCNPNKVDIVTVDYVDNSVQTGAETVYTSYEDCKFSQKVVREEPQCVGCHQMPQKNTIENVNIVTQVVKPEPRQIVYDTPEINYYENSVLFGEKTCNNCKEAKVVTISMPEYVDVDQVVVKPEQKVVNTYNPEYSVIQNDAQFGAKVCNDCGSSNTVVITKPAEVGFVQSVKKTVVDFVSWCMN